MNNEEKVDKPIDRFDSKTESKLLAALDETFKRIGQEVGYDRVLRKWR